MQALEIVQRTLGNSAKGIYLFGSSVIGGLRPHSDLDVFVAVDDSPPEAARRRLVSELLKVSGDGAEGGPARPLEVTIVRLSDVIPWRYPPRNELQYGEWLRPELEAGRIPPPGADPDLAVVLTQVRENSLTLSGPDADELFDPVPEDDLRRAIADSLPMLIAGVRGDERNALLTLARMWVTVATGDIVAKDVAAGWVLERVPAEHRGVLDLARRAYLGECGDPWGHRQEEVAAFVRHAEQAIRAYLRPR